MGMIYFASEQNQKIPTISGPGADVVNVTLPDVGIGQTTHHPIRNPAFVGQRMSVFADGPATAEVDCVLGPPLPNTELPNAINFTANSTAELVAVTQSSGLGWVWVSGTATQDFV